MPVWTIQATRLRAPVFGAVRHITMSAEDSWKASLRALEPEFEPSPEVFRCSTVTTSARDVRIIIRMYTAVNSPGGRLLQDGPFGSIREHIRWNGEDIILRSLIARQRPVFYGWWIVLSCTVISMWGGGIFYSFTAYVNPIVNEFGWTYLLVSLAASLRSVEMGIMAPVMGFLVDRFGSRQVVFFSGLLTGTGFILLSHTNSLATFYLAFFVLSIGWSGTGQVTTTTAIAGWFNRRIGLASGIVIAGYGIGGAMVPALVWLIGSYGWRSSLTLLGIATCLVVPSLALALRHRPEQYGYLPDGERQDDKHRKALSESTQAEQDYAVRPALRTRAFWIISAVFTIQFSVTNAVTLHIMPYLGSLKIPLETASIVAMAIPILSVTGRLSFGWLGDVFGQKYLLSISFLLQSLGLAFLFTARNEPQVAFFLVFFGPAVGGSLVLRSAIIRKQFGRRAFGSIQGLVVAIMTVGGIIGPALAGWVFDVTGSYGIAWGTFAVLTTAAAVIILTVKATSPAARATSTVRQE